MIDMINLKKDFIDNMIKEGLGAEIASQKADELIPVFEKAYMEAREKIKLKRCTKARKEFALDMACLFIAECVVFPHVTGEPLTVAGVSGATTVFPHATGEPLETVDKWVSVYENRYKKDAKEIIEDKINSFYRYKNAGYLHTLARCVARKLNK